MQYQFKVFSSLFYQQIFKKKLIKNTIASTQCHLIQGIILGDHLELLNLNKADPCHKILNILKWSCDFLLCTKKENEL